MRLDIPKSLGSILDDYLDNFPQKRKLKQGMILAAFEKIVGSRIASEVEDLHFEHKKLVMKVKNPSWRHELHANRFSIQKKLNEQVKGKVIEEIIIRS